MDKENIVYVYKRMLFSLWKKGSSLTCDSTYELCGHYAK